jgi:uncharacterized protein (DUF1778 family)
MVLSVPPNDRDQIPFRLSRDHVKRLDKAAKYCGQTRQAFIQAAVLADIAEVEERKRMKQLRASRGSEEIPERDEVDSTVTPVQGLGIADALRRQREAAEPEPSLTPGQGQVVVNVGNNGGVGGGSSDTISQLAAYIVAGSNDYEQSSRLRAAVKILHTSVSSPEERKALAERLDAVVAAKKKEADNSGPGVLRSARMVFDKVADLLKG